MIRRFLARRRRAWLLGAGLATIGLTATVIGLSGVPLTPRATPTAPAADITLTVLTAASLTNAFTEIGQRFEALHPTVSVVFSFAGSQQLAQQINQGAPADVFASANPAQMDAAQAGGRITAAQVFALNQLVVVMPAQNLADLQRLQDLARPGLQLVLAAESVPVGQYTLDFLDKASQDAAFGVSYREAVLANVVSYEDNVRQVLAKVALGEADAGVVYTSDVGADRAKVQTLVIPDKLNTIAHYPIAALNDSPSADWAATFIRFVLSPEGQDVLTRHGFIPVESPPAAP